MKKQKLIYWLSTGILALMMLFSALNYFTNPEVIQSFQSSGFPGYFRIELGIAKILGVLVLLLPQFPGRVKEWAYAGFGIVFISAALLHITQSDGMVKILMPLIFLAILILSNSYYHRLQALQS